MKKSERLLNIVLLLRSGSSYSARDLATEFDVSIRTVYRDINDLSLHVPVYNDGGYRLLVNRSPTVSPFTDEELKEITRVIDEALKNGVVESNELLESILKRIDELLDGSK